MQPISAAILSESSADEAALQIIAETILQREIDLVKPRIQHRGWPAVKNVLPTTIKHLHYRTCAEILILVVDSDTTAIHDPVHNPSDKSSDCRHCSLRRTADRIMSGLSPVPNRNPLNIAIGVAVPTIEAWYLCGIPPHASEASWRIGLQSHTYPYTKNELKQMKYGTDRPSIALETDKAMENARRLAQSPDALRKWFPIGFGALENDLNRSVSGHEFPRVCI